MDGAENWPWSSWSPTDIAAFAGLGLSIAIPLGQTLHRRWTNRLRLRREVELLPEPRNDYTSGWYSVGIHHDGGPTLKAQGLDLMLACNISSGKGGDQEGEDRAGESPILAPLTFSLMDPLTSDKRPMFQPGDTFVYATTFTDQIPWELVDTRGRFATLRMWCQGRVVKKWNVSHELRPYLPVLVEWRREGVEAKGTDPAIIAALQEHAKPGGD